MNDIKSVVVYCASSTQLDPAFYQAATELGKLLGENHIRLINGAGKMGMMSATTDAVLANGGEATGVIPQFMVDQNWHHKGMTQLIITKDMHERKETMLKLSDAVIALPGGVGTFEELFEVITWKQLGLYLNPIVILNTNGYYNPLIEMLHKAVNNNLMRILHADIWKVAETPEECIQLIKKTPLWDKSIRKFAAI